MILLIAIVGMTLLCTAQEVKVPKFTKFVFVKEGVNIRKSPSTQSEKLVWYEDETQWPWGYYGWTGSNENSPKTSAATKHVNFLPVIDETAEWYHVLCVDNNYRRFFHGFISKKLCKVMKQKAISEDYPICNITTITTGKYKGQSEIEGCFKGPFICGIIVGQIINGVAVGRYLISDNYSQYVDLDDQTKKDRFLDKLPVSYIYGLPGSAEGREGLIADEGAIVLTLDIDTYDGPTY